MTGDTAVPTMRDRDREPKTSSSLPTPFPLLNRGGEGRDEDVFDSRPLKDRSRSPSRSMASGAHGATSASGAFGASGQNHIDPGPPTLVAVNLVIDVMCDSCDSWW